MSFMTSWPACQMGWEQQSDCHFRHNQLQNEVGKRLTWMWRLQELCTKAI
jgi:hypothetical protein